MNFSDNSDTQAEKAVNRAGASAVLAHEAGVPFQPPLGNDSGIDPIAEWLSLMEVVQMLCPVWHVRDSHMRGNHWRIWWRMAPVGMGQVVYAVKSDPAATSAAVVCEA